MSKLIH